MDTLLSTVRGQRKESMGGPKVRILPLVIRGRAEQPPSGGRRDKQKNPLRDQKQTEGDRGGGFRVIGRKLKGCDVR